MTDPRAKADPPTAEIPPVPTAGPEQAPTQEPEQAPPQEPEQAPVARPRPAPPRSTPTVHLPSPKPANTRTVPVPPSPAPVCGVPTLWLPPPPHLGPAAEADRATVHRGPEHSADAAPPLPPPDRRPRLTPLTMAAIGGVVILFLTLAWVVFTHLPSPGGGAAPGPTAAPAPIPPGFTAAERACITSTESRNRKLFEKATLEWQDGTLPVDVQGNPAYREYADAVEALNLRACPRRYADAYATWVSVWRGYGTYLEDMSKPHLPWDDEWSDKTIAAKRTEYEAGVRGAYTAIRGTARSGGVYLPDQSWTPKV